MKCKDCAASVKVKCPECEKETIICTEGDIGLIEFTHWDNEDKPFCDGIG